METASVSEVVEHMRLVQEVDPSYPIILGVDGRVLDGMHRVARALLLGQPEQACDDGRYKGHHPRDGREEQRRCEEGEGRTAPVVRRFVQVQPRL